MAQNTQYRGREDLKEKATDQFEKMADRATDQFKNVADQVEGMATRVADQGREMGQQVGEVADRFKGAVNTSIKEQPMTTLALAAVAGFVLGALWKS
jgi:ElaB/YqjD/DUF883 family membrane-anchored ribosome-binding protein